MHDLSFKIKQGVEMGVVLKDLAIFSNKLGNEGVIVTDVIGPFSNENLKEYVYVFKVNKEIKND